MDTKDFENIINDKEQDYQCALAIFNHDHDSLKDCLITVGFFIQP